MYKDPKWPATIASSLPSSRPYLDSVVDSAGGDIPAQALKARLRPGGRVVIFGMTATPSTPVTMREVLRNVDVCGSTMGSAKEFRDVLKFIEKHRIVPVIDTTLQGLENATKGFSLLANADSRSGGKVVVRIDSDKSKL